MGKIADALEKIDTLNDFSSLSKNEPEVPPIETVKEPEPPLIDSGKEAQPPQSETVTEVISPAVLSARKSQLSANTTTASGKWDTRLSRAVNNDSQIPEIFKTLRSKILYPLDGQTVPKSIMISSCIPKEGKTFVAANLGISLASGMDQHCLIVDCDLRQPNLAKMFGIQASFGLVDYLRDQVDLSKLIVKTSIPKLSVLPAGKAPRNPAELLSSTRMKRLMQEISSRYDDRIVIFDSPPLLVAAESIVLSSQVDTLILVVRRAKVKKGEVVKFISTVDENKILGIVFNDHTENYFDQSMGYGYSYGY